MTTWNPSQYLKFESERTQPARDLASRIVLDAPHRIVDLGCGTGTSTAVLCHRWPEAQVSGIDSSDEMIARCKQGQPDLTWYQQDITNWSPKENYDLIFSNAAFQWIRKLSLVLPKLMSCLPPRGVLAFQVPNNESSPYHQCILEVADSVRWKEKVGSVRSPLTYKPSSFYYDLLSPLSSKLEIWETKYYQTMEDHQAIVEWVSGTGLRPYLQALPTDQDQDAFKADLLEKYQEAFSTGSDGKVLFPFNRQFVIACKQC